MISYPNFIKESFIEDFNSKYYKIFNDVDIKIKDDLGKLFNKLSNESVFSKIIKVVYDFTMSNKNNFNSLVDSYENYGDIDELIKDNLFVIFFGIRGSTIKLGMDTFTMPLIFERSRDKHLLKLMSMDESGFSSAIDSYCEELFKQLKEDSGIEDIEENDAEVDLENEEENEEKSEFDKDAELKKYKDTSKSWFNGIYELLVRNINDTRTKINSEERKNRTIYSFSDYLNSDNKDAKNQFLKKITDLDKDKLNSLGSIAGLDQEETGEF